MLSFKYVGNGAGYEELLSLALGPKAGRGSPVLCHQHYGTNVRKRKLAGDIDPRRTQVLPASRMTGSML